jgi:hypothetical protein
VDIAVTHLISVMLVGFGGWIIAVSSVQSDMFPVWFALGALTIAIGLISALDERRFRSSPSR